MARLISTTALLILPAIFGLLMPLCIAGNVLYSGETLRSGESLSLGSISFSMGRDCALVLRDGETLVWRSNDPWSDTGCYARLRTDGGLTVYSSKSLIIWRSGSAGVNGQYVLVLQPQRKAVIYGGAIWSTAGVGVAMTKNSSDQNIAMVTN